MLALIWLGTLVLLALWSLLAWGTHAVLTGGGDWVAGLAATLLADAAWQAWLDAALAWTAQFGSVIVWVLWAVGAVVLLLAAVVGTLLVHAGRRVTGGDVLGRLRAMGAGLR